MEVHGDITAVLLARVHDVRLVEHMELAIRNDLLQVVRQHLAADVDAFNALTNTTPADERNNVCEAETWVARNI